MDFIECMHELKFSLTTIPIPDFWKRDAWRYLEVGKEEGSIVLGKYKCLEII